MLHQDRPENPKFGDQETGIGVSSSSSLQLLRNSQQQPSRNREKDSNFNFLGQEDEVTTGDQNRNQMRPRNLGQPGRDVPPELSSGHYGPVSPLSRLPCWSPLEPLPEIESGDDCYGRVPPDGAEEGKMEEETGRMSDGDKEKGPRGVGGRGGGRRQKEAGELLLPDGEGGEEELDEEGLAEEEELEENRVEWDDSDSEFDFCCTSGGSLSSLNMESGAEGAPEGGWDRIGVGETRSNLQEVDRTRGATEDLSRPPRKWEECSNRRGGGKKTLAGSALGSSLLEDERVGGGYSDSDTDPCDERSELLDSVWTLRDRERFKAQEMEKHQVQLTMYRRLALIRWVRTLQSRVHEQQNRLQSSFDVILDHRKELLRMVTTTPATATASQS